jgi:hypothetical protein
MDVRRLASEHVSRFNDGIAAGDFSGFVAGFADDATMSFGNMPLGPFVGRAAIGTAYRMSPPKDAIVVVDIRPTGPASATVEYAWRADPVSTGRMALSWHADGHVRTLEIQLP